ncbi:MAG TPA: MFS transporter, partial [Candidatus Eisenbacteria bacterium]|nr:MFS transporter [Candidatus Eisenbacteria bacterium]
MRRGRWPAGLLGGLPRDFLLLWFGQSVSGFGTQLRRIALPTTAIVVFNATPLQISFISLCTYSGLLAFGLPAGIWIDRWDRRRVMLACDAVQTVTLASIPAAFIAGHLS